MIGIIGAGRMALEHFKVLNHLNKDVIFFANKGESAKQIAKMTSKTVITDNYLNSAELRNLDQVIVASPIDTLLYITIELVKHKIDSILVEKPLVMNKTDFDLLRKFPNHRNIFVGFNRRFYKSVQECIRICDNDGGIRSCTFSFDENIRNWKHPYNVLSTFEGKNPIISQSSHLIDLVFHLIGIPKSIEIKAIKPSSVINDQIIYGVGESVRDIPFVFMSDWSTPGNWKIELNTNNYKLILSPLETLRITNFTRNDGVNIENQWLKTVKILDSDEFDTKFKPGIYQQDLAFINRDFDRLLGLAEYEEAFSFIEKIQNVFKN